MKWHFQGKSIYFSRFNIFLYLLNIFRYLWYINSKIQNISVQIKIDNLGELNRCHKLGIYGSLVCLFKISFKKIHCFIAYLLQTMHVNTVEKFINNSLSNVQCSTKWGPWLTWTWYCKKVERVSKWVNYWNLNLFSRFSITYWMKEDKKQMSIHHFMSRR